MWLHTSVCLLDDLWHWARPPGYKYLQWQFKMYIFLVAASCTHYPSITWQGCSAQLEGSEASISALGVSLPLFLSRLDMDEIPWQMVRQMVFNTFHWSTDCDWDCGFLNDAFSSTTYPDIRVSMYATMSYLWMRGININNISRGYCTLCLKSCLTENNDKENLLK